MDLGLDLHLGQDAADDGGVEVAKAVTVDPVKMLGLQTPMTPPQSQSQVEGDIIPFMGGSSNQGGSGQVQNSKDHRFQHFMEAPIPTAAGTREGAGAGVGKQQAAG